MTEANAWQGRVAVVTGGGSGIGLAIAERLATAGLSVVLADRDATRLDEAESRVRAAGAPRTLAVVCDVADPASVEALAHAAIEGLGNVHVLCNNAGVIRPGRVWETSDADWSAVLDVNLRGIVNGARAFVPHMLGHGEPSHIVNTASAGGLFSPPTFAAYGVSKMAAIGLSEQLAADLATVPGAQIRVSALCPGGVASNLYRDELARDGHDTSALGEHSAQRWADVSRSDRGDQFGPETIADAVWEALQDGRFWILPVQEWMLDAARDRARRLVTALGRPGDDPGERMRSYFAAVDEGRGADALAHLHPDLSFQFARPGGPSGGREQLAAYIAERPPLTHRLDHVAVDGDVALTIGASVDGSTSLGAFVAAMHLAPDGRIDRYLASFFPGLSFGH